MDYLLNKYLGKLLELVKTSVLNLIINGLPSKHIIEMVKTKKIMSIVLNLIINGLPSKLKVNLIIWFMLMCFKPYYKWITF